MKFIAEQQIEEAVLEILRELGYTVFYGPDIAPDGSKPERAKWNDVVLAERPRARYLPSHYGWDASPLFPVKSILLKRLSFKNFLIYASSCVQDSQPRLYETGI